MYKITSDSARGLLRLQLTGFWDLDAVERFKEDYRQAVTSLPCPPGTHLVLADASDAPAQSQEVVGALLHFLETYEYKAHRLAFITGSALIAIQARRLLSRPHLLVTSSVEEAESFLFDPAG